MKKIIAGVLAALMMLSCVCAMAYTEFEISIDENGVATWEAVDGAAFYDVGYLYDAGNDTIDHSGVIISTTGTSVQAYEGYMIEVMVFDADGNHIGAGVSDVYGDSANRQEIDINAAQASAGGVPEGITLREDGIAEWASVDGAAYYTVSYLYRDGENFASASYWYNTTDTFAQAYEGYCVEVIAFDANGNFIVGYSTDFYGDPNNMAELPTSEDLNAEAVNMYGEIIAVEPGDDRIARWQSVEGAAYYSYYYICEENGQMIPVGVPVKTYLLEAPLFEGYKVFVEAYDANDNYIMCGETDIYGDATNIWPIFEPVRMENLTAGNIRLRANGYGYGEWEDYEGAVYYQLEIFDVSTHNVIMEQTYVADKNSIEVPIDKQVVIWACDAEGRRLDGVTFEYRTQTVVLESDEAPVALAPEEAAPVELMYADINALNTLRYPENLVPGSLVETEGGVEFTLAAYDGRQIRFRGDNVSLNADGALVISREGKLYNRDIIGRIMCADADVAEQDTVYTFGLGYTFGPDSIEEYWQIQSTVWGGKLENADLSGMQPNFIVINPNGSMIDPATAENAESITVNSLSFMYEDGETGIRAMELDNDFYPRMFAGDIYPAELEEHTDTGNMDYVPMFYLNVEPDAPGADISASAYSVYCVRWIHTAGDLKDANGNVVSKDERLPEGAMLEVTVGEYTCDVPVVMDEYNAGSTYYEVYGNVYAAPVGDVQALVVPIVWADHTDRANETNYTDMLSVFGNTETLYGEQHVFETNNSGGLTASRYFDISSYGALDMDFVVADWFYSEYCYADMCNAAPDGVYYNEVLSRIKQENPDVDWARFDADGDGYIDVVIFVNTGYFEDTPDGYITESYAGAFARNSAPETVGNPSSPFVHNFVNVSFRCLRDENNAGELSCNTVVHETSHMFGQTDFYDVKYTGIDVVGRYDMMSGSRGDWNVFSKYAVGWVEPVVITEDMFAGGESIEITIGAFAETGDFLLIPAAGDDFNGTPFDEYITVELFTDKGVHAYYSAEYGPEGTDGVRIYHVSAKNAAIGKNADGTPFASNVRTTTGVTYASYRYDMYMVELIQAGGVNCFTDIDGANRDFEAGDLFMPGDVFTAEAYSDFMYEGRMDYGAEFGYAIEVVSVSDTEAVIRITRQ